MSTCLGILSKRNVEFKVGIFFFSAHAMNISPPVRDAVEDQRVRRRDKIMLELTAPLLRRFSTANNGWQVSNFLSLPLSFLSASIYLLYLS